MYSKGSVTATSSNAHGSDTRSYKLIGDVHLLLLDPAGRVLMGRRQNTGLMDGTYHVPGGHLEAGESVVEAVIREAREEVGVTIDPEYLEFAHIMHSPVTGGRASFFFCARQWKGIPANREPRKCSELRWFPLDALPEATLSYCRVALEHIAAGHPFSVCGWEAQPGTGARARTSKRALAPRTAHGGLKKTPQAASVIRLTCAADPAGPPGALDFPKHSRVPGRQNSLVILRADLQQLEAKRFDPVRHAEKRRLIR